MYVAVQNVPRRERYLSENVILVGIIPGPKEPKKNCNAYLKPFVDELRKLWDGIVTITASGMQVLMRAALICVACDIPASRKVSGFVGHNANHACSRCLKSFPTETFGEKADYTGTDRSLWSSRSLASHRHFAEQHRNAITDSDRKKIEREHGCRYSVLLQLPYFDVIRFTIVDPMHNLLLGSAKHMFSMWTSLGLIDKEHFELIQKIVDSFVTPSDLGRIPLKIGSNFSGFTAEQWRNWTLIYSLCSLKDILPHKHYDCWLLFTKAVSIFCQREITIEEVNKGDKLIMEFCEAFELLYDKKSYTINLHLHGHLKECILDFGPVYSFWLFSYERMNGILGSFHTNSHDIYLQLMRKYTSSQLVSIPHWPAEFRSQFSPLLVGHCFQEGSLKAHTLTEALKGAIILVPPLIEKAWQPSDEEKLADLISSTIGHSDYKILMLYQMTSTLIASGFVLGSVSSRHASKSHIMAIHPLYPNELYLAKIEHFCQIHFRNNLNNKLISKWIVCVTFHDPHACKVWFGGHIQVWCRSTTTGMYYIQLSSVQSRIASCERTVNFGTRIGKQNVLVVSVLSNYSS